VSFGSLSLHPDLLKGVKELGFQRPTPIQMDAIPPGVEGRDLLACAMTGSGKTAAFLLPVLHRLMSRPRGTTRALILTPTRELAAQILQECNELATHTPIAAAAVFGGVGMGPQEHAFRTGVDIIVATPGRLLDHLKQPYAKLDKLEHLVLDEVDRMLDMGFRPDILRVLKYLPQKKQTLFFSATMPAPIIELTRGLLRDPVSINLARKVAPPVGITQAVYPVAQTAKAALLLELLQRDLMHEALVFTRTKHRANRLWQMLTKNGISCARIHGNRSQPQRTEALEGFKSGRYRVLVATDIAARGIDVEELGHVVNFDVPAVPEDYVHRIGRTARAELTGDAYTFVSPDEMDDLRAIEKVLGKPLLRVTLPDFDASGKSGEKLEIPIAERLAAHRAHRAVERERAKAKLERKNAGGTSAHGQRPRAEARRPAQQGDSPYATTPQQRSEAPAGVRSGRARRGKHHRGRGPKPKP
jgi:ATP-dependent RNA helicase RhlE